MSDELLKVMLVDDEDLVRDLLKKCINWQEIGYEVVGEASCAQEALDLIEQLTPDVVFTDICMPYIDGIEFAKTAFERFPSIKIVILTGYEEFEYAKRGIKIGIADFLLKPINDEEIIKVALGLKEKIQTERSRINEYAGLKKHLEENLPFLRERLLNELIQKKPDSKDLQRRLDYYGIRLGPAFCQVVLVEVLHTDTEKSGGEEKMLLLKMRCTELVSLYFKEDDYVNVFLDNSQRTVILNTDKTVDTAACAENLMTMLINRMKCFICIGIGGSYEGSDKIMLSYREACNALDYKVIAGKNQVIGFSDINFSAHGRGRMEEDLSDALVFSIKTGMKGKAIETLELMFNEGNAGFQSGIDSIRTSASSIVSAVLNVTTETGIDIKDIFGGSQPFEKVFRLDTFPELKDYLKSLIAAATEAIEGIRSKKVNQTIQQIRDYIFQNLSDSELTLSGTAKAFFINVSYLSRVFKQETGQTFVEYLTKARLEKAMKLLRETDLKAYQIAWDVGFVDPHYFGICFKKYSGMSVNDYKKELINSH